MSFWEDASPVVKGAIVIGAIGLIYFGVAFAFGWMPFGGGDEATTQERGLQPPGEAQAAE
ncbi:MAG TPA: hypothetical protein RMH85_07035 [Polyangiaceae bacterium LLY-WYZ-15_(1-7)]|nr:hypothetical protein [Myxococcales bacterium]MAT26391.1 hypothetical protein [Sandaracinus sp.]HJL05206.1 hypothetical protein [Polyangiaceae bacterium LLY-WYZ-15_(1-7)]HJL08233.1 hypothetical protein [Polyangiaceae bacterium LLY-WYZ-15_(1-7)]HJL23476.1 hypothetical protein [Polyangiaceae bacterium LLY-WYZ-15_(1-7)]